MFKNNTAVITGAASGIGKALAHKCSKEGMHLVLADINQDALLDLQQQLPNAYCIRADVAQLSQVEQMLQEAVQKFGSIQFLFNNAGIAGPMGPIWTVPPTSMQKMLDVNLLGMIHVLHTFVPEMLKQNQESYIVNTAALSGLVTYPYFSPYQISKHAVVALSECLYHDLAALNSKIKVSVLCPGWIKTNIPGSLDIGSDDAFKGIDLEWLIAYGKNIKNGMDPLELADITFNAMKENKFYIYTHPLMQKAVRERFEAILGEDKPARFEV